jgi:hypothetical protein
MTTNEYLLKNKIITELEFEILELLNYASSPMSVIEIGKKIYKKAKVPPLNPNNAVTVIIKQINRKCERHNLDWFIEGEGLGRQGKKVWLSARKPL